MHLLLLCLLTIMDILETFEFQVRALLLLLKLHHSLCVLLLHVYSLLDIFPTPTFTISDKASGNNCISVELVIILDLVFLK